MGTARVRNSKKSKVVKLNLPLVAWLQLGQAFSHIPKDSRNTPEVNATMTRLTPQIVDLVRANSMPTGKRKDGSKSYKTAIDTETFVALTLPSDDAGFIRDALQSMADDDSTGEHAWWLTPSLEKANDALTYYSIDFKPGELEKILGRPIADGEEISIEIEPTDDPEVGKVVAIGGKRVAA